MNAILSIQSNVAYGYVGNKAAVYPLQAMGYDVWPIHTVQFSNHTGYGQWQGEIFSAEHIEQVVQGIFDIDQAHNCTAILSGYMGSRDICEAMTRIVQKFKAINPEIIYLCDPVIGNQHCFVKPEVLDYFKTDLSADIITPNQFEAETLSGLTIQSRQDCQIVADYFHHRGTKIVVITGIKMADEEGLMVFASNAQEAHVVSIREFHFDPPVNGTGDLFSSTFLGVYCQQGDLKTALTRATSYLEQALSATQQAKSRELQVLKVKY